MASAGNYGMGMQIGGMAQQDIGNWVTPLLQGRESRKALDEANEIYNKYYNEAVGYYKPYAANAEADYNTLRQGVNSGRYDDPQYNFQYGQQEPNYGAAPQYQEQAFNFQDDPGYQFRMQQGSNAIENSAAARGSQLSGATLKALARYGQDFASNEYGNAYGRYQDQRNFGRNKYLDDVSNYQNNRNFAAGRYDTNRNYAANQYNTAYNANAANRANQYNRAANLANIGYGANQTLAGMATNQGNTLADLAYQRAAVMNGQYAGLNAANWGMGQHFQEIGAMGNSMGGGSGGGGGMGSIGGMMGGSGGGSGTQIPQNGNLGTNFYKSPYQR